MIEQKSSYQIPTTPPATELSKVRVAKYMARPGLARDIGASITSGGGNGRMKDSTKLSPERYHGACLLRENLITA